MENSAGFESVLEPTVVIQLPQKHMLDKCFGEDYSYAASVSRQRSTDSFFRENMSWIPAINGGDRINSNTSKRHVFT